MASFAADSIAPLQPKAGFDCADGGLSQQQPMGQSKLGRRQKMSICCSIALACGGAGMFGFFTVGPLIKNAMGASDLTNESHFQGSSKFMIPHAGRLSGPARTGLTVASDIAPPMAPIGAVSASMTPAVASNENSQLSQLQARVVELKNMLEERQAHQLSEGRASHEPTPVHSKTGLFGALLAVLGMGMGGVVMHAISGNSNSAAARSRLAAVTMSANDPSLAMSSPISRSSAPMMQAETAAGTDVVALAKSMPGITEPLGFWDPLGLTNDISAGKLRFYREVELKHGRVAMLAALGFLVGEQYHPLFGGDIDVPSYVAFQATPLETAPYALPSVLVSIAILEILSIYSFNDPANNEPSGDADFLAREPWTIRSDHLAGDFGFDPLGIKPTDPQEFKEMQTKEINNGRLAMIGIAGMVVQELVSDDYLF